MLDRPHLPGSAAVTEIVRSILAKHPGSGPVMPDADLSGLGLNSIDMVELMLAVEEEFDLTIPPAEITVENFRSVSAVCRLIERLRPPE